MLVYQKVNNSLLWFCFLISKEQNPQFFPVVDRFTFVCLFDKTCTFCCAVPGL